MDSFAATQTRLNEEFRNQNLHTSEALRQLSTMVESIMTPIKALETHILRLPHTPLGPFHEGHMNVVTTRSEKQIENSKENDKKVEESSGERKVEIMKNQPTTPIKEVVEEVEKKTSYISPPHYKPPIPFPKIYVESKIGVQSKRYAEILKKIHTTVPLFEDLFKKRKLEDHQTEEIIDVNM